MTKEQIRLNALRFIKNFTADQNVNDKIATKFSNICAKTGGYDVPEALFQKRTPRKNRVLISWKTVKNNNLTYEQLNSFSGGVAVEFVNEDYFEESNQNNPLFILLKQKLGSNENVSSIITIRSETGSSSSQPQRDAFEKLTNNFHVNYLGNDVIINKDNYCDYALKKTMVGGIGNEKWSGFLFVLIRGGQQDVICTPQEEQLIFNPACEFANANVCIDLDLTMLYFAFVSIDIDSLDDEKRLSYSINFEFIKSALRESKYDSDAFKGNLLDYCENHPSVKMMPGKLCDPIQVEPISFIDFAIDNKEDMRNLDFTHDEAVNLGKYYWDSEKNCILSPARPTNVFWSKHLSNMMQQNFSLKEYFKHEEEIVNRRKALL